jgi:mannosyltransferase OCH1-like enzyme
LKGGNEEFQNVLLPESITHAHSQIPRVILFTSKYQCLTPDFVQNLNRWKFDNYSVVLHDDMAVDRFLFQKGPHIELLVHHCMVSGAAKANLWRALVLWEYSGIYSDIDNAPGPKFYNGSVIAPAMDSYFLIEQLGIASQYFMAAAPRHPLINYWATPT